MEVMVKGIQNYLCQVFYLKDLLTFLFNHLYSECCFLLGLVFKRRLSNKND